MKKKIKLLVIFMIILSFTGCIKYDHKMVIKSDRSMDYSIIYGIAKDFAEGGTMNVDEDGLKRAKEKGFDIKDYKDENYIGSVLTVKVPDINELSNLTGSTFSINQFFSEDNDESFLDAENKPIMFKRKSGIFIDEYSAVFTFDYNQELNGGSTDSSSESEQLSEALKEQLGDSLDLKFTVTVPNKVLSSNAMEVNGNTLTWNMASDDFKTIEFSFNMYNIMPIVVTFCVVFLFGLITIFAILNSIANKRKNAHLEAVTGEKKSGEKVDLTTNNDLAYVKRNNLEPEKDENGNEKNMIEEGIASEEIVARVTIAPKEVVTPTEEEKTPIGFSNIFGFEEVVHKEIDEKNVIKTDLSAFNATPDQDDSGFNTAFMSFQEEAMDKLYDENSAKPVVPTDSAPVAPVTPASVAPVVVPEAAPEVPVANPTNMEVVSLDSAFNVAPVLDTPQQPIEKVEELDSIEMPAEKVETPTVVAPVENAPEMPIPTMPTDEVIPPIPQMDNVETKEDDLEEL